MFYEYKLYFYRHKPLIVLSIMIIIGCLLQFTILSDENMKTIQESISVDSKSLIFQNFSIDMIIFMAMIYYIFCSASSIINDKKNGVFIYSLVKNVHPIKIISNKFIASCIFVISCNLIIIFTVSIITSFVYGGEKEIILNGLILLFTKSYTAIFYITLAILFALLVNNYVLVLSILFFVEMSKIGIYTLLNKFAFSKFIILNHIDISNFFNLPSTGVNRGYTLLFSINIYFIYILIIQMIIYFAFTKKRRGLI